MLDTNSRSSFRFLSSNISTYCSPHPFPTDQSVSIAKQNRTAAFIIRRLPQIPTAGISSALTPIRSVFLSARALHQETLGSPAHARREYSRGSSIPDRQFSFLAGIGLLASSSRGICPGRNLVSGAFFPSVDDRRFLKRP